MLNFARNEMVQEQLMATVEFAILHMRSGPGGKLWKALIKVQNIMQLSRKIFSELLQLFLKNSF